MHTFLKLCVGVIQYGVMVKTLDLRLRGHLIVIIRGIFLK